MSEHDFLRRDGSPWRHGAPPREKSFNYLLNRQDGGAERRRLDFSEMESLILAQNERWRHGLGMQVERGPSGSSGGRVSNT